MMEKNFDKEIAKLTNEKATMNAVKWTGKIII